ncbi:MAG: hypothetical protein IIZ39_10950 [Blautia sp.]|nr:hypothetical protein [Blautia sp.]
MKKLAAMALALVMGLSLSSAAFADSYYMTFDSNLVDEVGWWFCNDISITVKEDGAYELILHTDIFGTTDPGVKGNKTVKYAGTCTVAPSADGETSHLDITLDTVDSVFLEQHGKAFGRQVLNFAMVLDTDSWTDDMEDIYGDTVEAFLEAHQAPLGAVLTVEDLALDYDDVTLENRIVSGIDAATLDIAE